MTDDEERATLRTVAKAARVLLDASWTSDESDARHNLSVALAELAELEEHDPYRT